MSPFARSILSSSVLLSILAASCGGDAPGAATTGAPLAAAPAATAESGGFGARDVFDGVCFTCHGGTGHGDGPGAAACNPKPRTFADAAWQDGISDEMIKKVIVMGGVANGKTATMPAHPQFKGQDQMLDGLVAIVRGFKGK
jgi:cytochrome c oxidase cbb3-type subunit 3